MSEGDGSKKKGRVEKGPHAVFSPKKKVQYSSSCFAAGSEPATRPTENSTSRRRKGKGEKGKKEKKEKVALTGANSDHFPQIKKRGSGGEWEKSSSSIVSFPSRCLLERASFPSLPVFNLYLSTIQLGVERGGKKRGGGKEKMREREPPPRPTRKVTYSITFPGPYL